VFCEKSKILVSKLQKEVGSEGFDMYPYITRCALDIICGELVAEAIMLASQAQSLN
jgi:cytochrome P450 family 4